MLKFLITDQYDNQTEKFFDKKVVNIGRSEENDLAFEDDLRISGNHCSIILEKDKIYLKDKDSKNGTFVNSKKIGKDKVEISSSDLIKVGRTTIQVVFQDEDQYVKGTKFIVDFADEEKINEDKTSPKIFDEVDNIIDQVTVLRTISEDDLAATKNVKSAEIHEIKTQFAKLQTNIKSTQKIMERYFALNKAAQTINSCLDIKLQLERILEEAMKLLNAQEGFLLSFDKTKKSIQVEAVKQIEHMKKFQPFFSREIVNECITRARPIIFGEAQGKKDFKLTESLLNIASVVCVPIRFANEILGVIYLDDKTNLNKFDSHDKDLLQTFASHCAVAMKNAKLIERVKKDERKMMSLQRFLPMNLAHKVAESSICINLGGEKRECTTMFTDIRSFSSIAEKLSPHEIVNLLNEYFSEMVKIIFKYQGTLDKFLGDGIMAIFGAPIAIGNHALAAVNTAIEMQEAVRSLNLKKEDEERITFEIGIGIDTGEAIAGNIGSDERMEYTVIGNPVNISSRLCGIAKRGQILISNATFIELEKEKDKERNFETDCIGWVELKNISKKVKAHQIKYTLI